MQPIGLYESISSCKQKAILDRCIVRNAHNTEATLVRCPSRKLNYCRETVRRALSVYILLTVAKL